MESPATPRTPGTRGSPHPCVHTPSCAKSSTCCRSKRSRELNAQKKARQHEKQETKRQCTKLRVEGRRALPLDSDSGSNPDSETEGVDDSLPANPPTQAANKGGEDCPSCPML